MRALSELKNEIDQARKKTGWCGSELVDELLYRCELLDQYHKVDALLQFLRDGRTVLPVLAEVNDQIQETLWVASRTAREGTCSEAVCYSEAETEELGKLGFQPITNLNGKPFAVNAQVDLMNSYDENRDGEQLEVNKPDTMTFIATHPDVNDFDIGAAAFQDDPLELAF